MSISGEMTMSLMNGDELVVCLSVYGQTLRHTAVMTLDEYLQLKHYVIDEW